jgi:septum formation protein
MLNKPTDEADARRMLMAMKNRTHEVHTGYVVQDMISGKREKGVHTAVVTMRNYSQTEIEAYIATGDPMDKAGAYAIQHPVFRPVRKLEGCFLSVMGLPLCTLLNLFTRFELAVDVDLTAVYQAHHQYPCPILQSRF